MEGARPVAEDAQGDVLAWLQRWYARHCDGDWEHSFGIDITTLDNPGWRVRINLAGTALEDQPFAPVTRETSEHEWLNCRVQEKVFECACGAYQLGAILEVFRAWAGSMENAG